MTDDRKTTSQCRCARCGMEMPPPPVPELCPKCLLEAGFRTEPSAAEPGTAPPPSRAAKGLPQPGEDFGHYHLVRRLGQGGMGVVYEADDVESGRRVALKVLSQALDSPEARKRFLREGQLAASVNHPNSVYVFGTEEIGGTPVIAMELVPRGTLQERVAASGPLPVPEAADCALQIIAGLEAAQQLGILHRDIKPSNCFVDNDGTVKIGDFGLSIGTGVRTEPEQTSQGKVFGTPSFSSPEQLRGEELTVRSDIYALGVTLYYLLTAQKPFEAPNLVQMLATVLERRAESPARWQPGIPTGLCRVVLRCLEKDPRERFETYASLREALLPYTSTAALPASPGPRFLAGVIDLTLLSPVLAMLNTSIQGWLGTALVYSLMLLYFGGLEGFWGASIGKALLRLRVVRPGVNRPALARAFLRATVFLGAAFLVTDLFDVFVLGIKEGGEQFGSVEAAQAGGSMLISVVALGLLFSTARRQNGYAAIHERLSRTRVVCKVAFLARPKAALCPEPLANPGSAPRFGPYHLLARLGRSEDSQMFLAYDTRLLRKVWIREFAPGASPLPLELRNLARPARLRWLNSRRASTEAWDAYQAIEGQPLLEALTRKPSWANVRFWLLDLAAELKAALHDGSACPVLSLDRLWLRADGRLVLLDFPVPTQDGSLPLTQASAHTLAPAEPPPAPTGFLRQIALSALEGRALTVDESRRADVGLPLPLHARAFIEALGAGVNPGDAVRQLKQQSSKNTEITRAHRLVLLGGCISLPIFLTGAVLAMEPGNASPSVALELTWAFGILGVILPCWLAALCFRGGPMLHGLGIAVVTKQGRPASRVRVFLRNFTATLPFLVLPGIITLGGFEDDPFWVGRSLLALLAALTLISPLLPRRSLQDRLAGTFLVPR